MRFFPHIHFKVKVKVSQSCPTLCDPMDYTVHGILQAGVGSPSLLQGIFPMQGSNPGVPHCRKIFLPAEPQGKPQNTGVGSLSLLQQIFPIQELNWGLLHWILYQLRYQGSHGHFKNLSNFTIALKTGVCLL